jgi:hypothetical protein
MRSTTSFITTPEQTQGNNALFHFRESTHSSGDPSTLKVRLHKRIQLKIGRVKPHRAVSGASDFRNDSWAQAVKNLSAISGCLYRAAEEMDCRPRNFTKDA